MSLVNSFVRKHSGVKTITAIAFLALIAGFGIVFTETGCAGELGGECIRSGDCGPGLVCVYQFCTQQCADSRDCTEAVDPEATCVVAKGDALGPDAPPDDEFNVCQKPTVCGENIGTCASGQICVQNKCKRACDAPTIPCPGSDVCFHGACVAQSDLPDGGLDAAAENGLQCKIQSDCLSHNCLDGQCVQCKIDADCANGPRYCDTCEILTGRCVDVKPTGACSGGSGSGSGGSGSGGSSGGAGSSSGSGGAGSSSGSGSGGASGAGSSSSGGFTCIPGSSTPNVCGNMIQDPGEECDDGNCVPTDPCNNCKNAYCGDGVVQPPEMCDDGGEVCPPDCGVVPLSDAGPDGSGNPCMGKLVFAGFAQSDDGAFLYNGQIGLDAATAACQALGGFGMCDYDQWKQLETAPMMHPGDIAKLTMTIANGTCQSVWLQRTSIALDPGCPGGMSNPGPGGNCNNWNYTVGPTIADGELVDVCNMGGTITYTYHIDCDTVFDPMNPTLHDDPTLTCDVQRPIPCCYEKCISP